MNVVGFLGRFLSRRDWVYLLSLLVPFVVYDLVLKTSEILSRPDRHGFTRTLGLMQSDILFDLGYALFWVGIFTAVRGRSGLLHWFVVLLFHLTAVVMVIATTSAYQYFQETGNTLDYDVVALWIAKPKEVVPVLRESVPLSAWVLSVVALLYTLFGPWLLTRLIQRWRRRSWGALGGTPTGSLLDSLGLFLLALGIGLLSLLLMDVTPAGVSKSFARAPVVNLVVTGFEESTIHQSVGQAEDPAAHATLSQTAPTEKRNVVLIHLESTRAESTTPYSKALQTMPFLNELAKNSLLAENYYTTVPHTSKASVSVNCGIEPHLVSPTTEAEQPGVPAPCLASLLKDQGYRSVFFQSSTKEFENFEDLVKNFGYEEYYPLESMDTTGFKPTNYFGYEDDVMLKPSEEWLKEHGDKPFIAEYLLGTGHHDYQCLGLRYGDEEFSSQEPLNSYLNCLRYQDHFLENLMDQYKELGLYENTIFVLYGDHGEGFGEHGLYQHDDTIYQEGLKVPFMIHAPGLLDGGKRIEELTNHTDILPTVLDLLGYEVKGGQYPGYSLLGPLPKDRTLNFSCFHENQCLASLQGTQKYIYHYDNQPEEVFDLSKDPDEKRNLAGEYGKEELDKWRDDLLAWRSKVDAEYE